MILDTISNAEYYHPLHRLFPRALGFLSAQDLMALSPGRIDLTGTDLYVMMSAQKGKRQGEARLETHRKYIDIHYLLAGKETVGWRAAAECKGVEQEYNAGNDLMLFHDDPSFWFTMHPGMFAIFFPWDAHAPLVSEGNIHKVVVKAAF